MCSGAGQRAGSPGRSLVPALSVFLLFVAVGAGGLYYDQARRAPVKRAVPGSASVEGAAKEAHQGPRRHPNIELPADVIAFLDQLGEQAEAAPDDIELWQKLARARYRAGLLNRRHMPGAAQAVEHLLGLDADNLEALRTQANIVYDAGRYAEAEAGFRRYLALEPRDPAVTTDLASALLFQGRRAEALATYRDAVAADPQFFQARFNLGLALHAEGRTEEALVSLEKARELAEQPEQVRRAEEALAAASGRAGSAAGPSSNATTDFQRAVERLLAGHPIAGSKITAFDWKAGARGEVIMRGFPMQAMPAVVRNKFKSKLNASIAGLAAGHGVAGPITLELVDEASRESMDRLDGKELVGAFDPQP